MRPGLEELERDLREQHPGSGDVNGGVWGFAGKLGNV